MLFFYLNMLILFFYMEIKGEFYVEFKNIKLFFTILFEYVLLVLFIFISIGFKIVNLILLCQFITFKIKLINLIVLF